MVQGVFGFLGIFKIVVVHEGEASRFTRVVIGLYRDRSHLGKSKSYIAVKHEVLMKNGLSRIG